MNSLREKWQKAFTVQSIQNVVGEAVDWIICIYVFLILAVMPFYNQEGFSHIGTDKSYFFRQCSQTAGILILPLFALYLAAGVIIAVRKKRMTFFQIRKRLKANWSVTDLFVCLYGVSVLVSYAGSAYRQEALFGATGWYMGMFTQLTLVVVYFFISRMWKRNYMLVLIVLPASAAVFLLGFINRFGVYPIDMHLKSDAFISTIGNINWYCGYLTTVFFGGIALFWQMNGLKKWQRMFLAIYAFIGFASLVTQGSSSGILAMVTVLFVLFCLSAENGLLMKRFWEIMLMISGACLVCRLIQLTGIGQIYPDGIQDNLFMLLNNSRLAWIMTAVSFAALLWTVCSNDKGVYPISLFKKLAKIICFCAGGLLILYVCLLVTNTLMQGKISQTLGISNENMLMFTYQWGSDRGATWYVGAKCFLEQDFLHKVIGVGPDCMSAFLYQDGSAGLVQMVKEQFGDSRLTNAHNEWLTIVVDMGIFGCVSYIGIICTAILRFLKGMKHNAAAGACGFCVLAYTVNNLFSFQQSMNVTTIFILMGMGESFLREKEGSHISSKRA